VNIKVDFTTNDYRFMSCDDDAMLLGTDNRFYGKRKARRKIAHGKKMLLITINRAIVNLCGANEEKEKSEEVKSQAINR
jgi:hypothetical protein